MHVMVTSVISDDVRVALRPFRTYRELGGAAAPSLRRALLGPLGWLALLVCFVSWTTSGALMFDHLLFGPLVWWFAPAVQGGVSIGVARAYGERSFARSLSLYYRGHAPWQLLLLLVAGACLVVPDPSSILRSSVVPAALAVLVVVACVWCGVLTYAMYRAGFGFSRGRSARATALHYVGCTLNFTGWFLFTGQLLPLWGMM